MCWSSAGCVLVVKIPDTNVALPRWTTARRLVPMRRRSFLLLLSGLAAAVAGVRSLVPRPGMPESFNPATLAALLDTLFPADEGWPGALELDIPTAVAQDLWVQPGRRRQTIRLLWQIERNALRRHGQRFAALRAEAREQLLRTVLEESTALTEPFSRFRELAFEHYYSAPAVWGRLEDYHPPQPDGYPDYWQPPGHGKPT